QAKIGSVIVNYVDSEGNVIKAPVKDTTDAPVGTDYDTTDNKPTEIVTEDGTRYVLVPSKTIGSENGSVVEGETSITYVYQKVAKWIPLIPGVPENERPTTDYPFDPTKPDAEIPTIPTNPETEQPVVPYVPGYTPVDPKDNTPLTPVDPEDPSKGYVPPTPENPGIDTPIPYVPVETPKTGSVIVNYVDSEGNVIKAPVTDTDKATVGTDYDTTDNKPKEIVTEDGTRYVLVPSKTIGSENGQVVEGETSITYVYQKVANWIPQIPGVPSTDYPEVPYPFDPTNPDVPVTPNPGTVIPYVPGYVPVDPKNNQPLTPVDPEDPSKGYIPPTPENPGIDTPIPYVPVETPKTGSVVVNYVDSEGNVIKTPVTDTDKAAVGTDYDTTDNKPTEIVTEDGTRYVLVPSKTIGSENGQVVEGETSITYVYQKVANWIPQIPGVPSTDYPEVPYPFDPTNPDVPVTPNPGTVIPYVPGYTPVDPKDNTPLTPVDPEDPTKGYVPPTPENPGIDTPIPYVPVETPKTGSVVVNYVDSEGNVIKTPVTDTDKAAVGTDYDTTDNKPTEIVTEDGTRYILVPSKTIGSENGQVVEGETSITYVYQKVANWIPQIPGVPSTDYPEVPYPFDPTNPDVPVTPNPGTVIPYVPGYVPVDPKNNQPLTPVDPEDPSKGYIPPTPENPGIDTPIPYVPVKPTTPTTPVTPGNDVPNTDTPTTPDAPKPRPAVDAPAPGQKTVPASPKAVLPNTGQESSVMPTLLGLGLLLGTVASRRKKNED
ncbi:TPA: MucBP domain-containing protein, partial [Streptococcus suis]